MIKMNLFGVIFVVLIIIFFGVAIYYLYIEYGGGNNPKPPPNPPKPPIIVTPLPIPTTNPYNPCANINKNPCTTNNQCFGFPAPPVDLFQTVLDFNGAVWGLSDKGNVYYIANGTTVWSKVGNNVFNSIASLNDTEMVWTTGDSMVFSSANPNDPLETITWIPLGFSLNEVCVSDQGNFTGTFCGNTYVANTVNNGNIPTWTQVNNVVCKKSFPCDQFPIAPEDFVKVLTDSNGSGWALSDNQDTYFVLKSGTQWQKIPGKLIDIATAGTGNSTQVWGVNQSYSMYAINNVLKPTVWLEFFGTLSNICVNSKGNFTGSLKGIIWVSQTNNPNNPEWITAT